MVQLRRFIDIAHKCYFIFIHMCLWTEHGKKKKQKKSGHKKGKGDKLGQHAESQASLASDEGNGTTDVSVSAYLLNVLVFWHK